MSRAAVLLLAVLLLAVLLGACDPGPAVPDGGPAADARRDPTTTTRTLHIGAAAFVGDGGFGRMSQAGYLYPYAVTIAYAPIPLPADTVLESVTVFYVVGDGAVRPGVRRMDPSTGSITPVWSGANDADGAAIESQSEALGETMLDSEVYWVEVFLTGARNRVYGAAIEYADDPGGAP